VLPMAMTAWLLQDSHRLGQTASNSIAPPRVHQAGQGGQGEGQSPTTSQTEAGRVHQQERGGAQEASAGTAVGDVSGPGGTSPIENQQEDSEQWHGPDPDGECDVDVCDLGAVGQESPSRHRPQGREQQGSPEDVDPHLAEGGLEAGRAERVGWQELDAATGVQPGKQRVPEKPRQLPTSLTSRASYWRSDQPSARKCPLSRAPTATIDPHPE
jgi:hypothetical protein